MHFSLAFSVLILQILSVVVLSSPVHQVENGGISQVLYNELVFYYQYTSSIITANCSNPNGNTILTTFNGTFSSPGDAWVIRDDKRKEIVVVLRGSVTEEDMFSNLVLVLVPYISPGVSAPVGSMVHAGFLSYWNSIALRVLAFIEQQLKELPDYNLVSVGHSLGAGLASVAAVSIQQSYPSKIVRMYTYGQMRTGNEIYASFVNELFGANVFRSTHTDDEMPRIKAAGFRHHGVEYWQNPDPASPATVKKCAPDGEDSTCSDSVPWDNQNDVVEAHLIYYGIRVGTRFCTAADREDVPPSP